MSYRWGLPHLAYFKALANETSEQSSSWRSTLAGLVAMRLVDAWAEGDPLPAAGIQALERAIYMMDVEALDRPKLRRLYETLVAEKAGRNMADQSHVLRCVREYAEALWQTADWTLASDVCRTGIRHANTPTERALVPSLYDRLGNCLRAIGQPDKALEAFETGRAMCTRSDIESDLNLRISEANLEVQLGNTPMGERLLDEVFAEAMRAPLPRVCARADHDRGVIEYQRAETHAEFITALSLFFRALRTYDTDVGAERVLADIALVALELNYRDKARDAFLMLETHSIEQVQRWVASLNLMRIAMLDGDESRFHTYDRKLRDAHLSSRLRAHHALLVGEGCLRFERRSVAHRALIHARDVIRASRVNELETRLSNALRQLDETAPLPEIGSPGAALDEMEAFLSREWPAVTEWHRGRLAEVGAP